ncbi:hypothetical protein QVD17_19251 [Tagetes erecta]|uniref:AAA+ ATPase domain-containing protein n=1 Tax=Tagetes erecta TaxID=13708 RepID=A0AAD8KQM4_TARER|nr:hypothetical protein QVD17_19251 [Tagetes erecta]
MDAIVSSIVTPVVQSLMIPLKKHFGFLISSTKNVMDMEEKMVQLNLTEKDIQDKWDEAIERNHEMSHHVSPWLEKVKEMNEKAQTIPKGGVGCFNVAKRYKVGKKSFNILEEIEALETWKSKIVFTNAQRPLAKVVSTSTRPSTSTPGGSTQNNFKSRDSVYNAALAALRSNNESEKMIAICGMGGVGKTTMMEQLKKDVEASKHFDRVVKVVLGENTNPIVLQQDIAIYLDGKDLIEKDKDARADRLCKKFEDMSKQGKKTLIIMDDLWKAFDLKDVGLSPLLNGFKLLFTSRDERICAFMGVKVDSVFKVGLLNDIEAKSLFFSNVELSDGDDPTLQKIGENIVKKCHGLPIAILTIAKSLAGNIMEAWEKALRRLEQDDLKDIESITYKIFEMSYENLKEDGDKAIFLLSGLFPDDFDIRTEDLFRYGLGLGFFKDTKTLVTARSEMKICVNNLICANLLTTSDHKGCVKMHDLVRAFILDKISEVKQASICNHDNKSMHHLTKYVNKSYERILLKCTGMEAFPVDFNYPNLSLLLLMNGNNLLKFPDDIYKRIEKLQVVSYENMHIPSLLLTFEHSTKLRTLCLRSCQFINDDISLLGSLSNLETLSFVECKIRRLPSEIGKLEKLKLLDLTGCVYLRIDDGVFHNLSSLEELYMSAYKDSPIRFTEANFDELQILSDRLFALELEFFESKDKLKNMSIKKLKRFRISIGCALKDDKTNLFRNTIQFVGDCNELLECKINELFNKTEELHLQVNEMNHLEDVITHHSFSNLTALYVSECAHLTWLFTVDVARGLKKLERLSIFKCPVMRTLIAENNDVGAITFNKLKSMFLTGLPEMVSFGDTIIELPEMVELYLCSLPKFTSIFPQCHDTYDMQSVVNKKVVTPKLEKLTVAWMANLKDIWSYGHIDTNNATSKLREISVYECNKLVNLFPCNPLPLLNELQDLKVSLCNSIEVLFNMDFGSFCGTGESNSSKLRSIKLYSLGKLEELWRMKGVNNSNIPITCFKGVESIEITQCKMFMNIFTPTTTNFDLGALTKYTTDYTASFLALIEILVIHENSD